MSFTPAKIDLSSKSQVGLGSGIKAGIRGKVTPRLFLTVARPVAKDLGLIDGTPIEVLIGENEHHGLIRFRKHESGLAYVEDATTRGNGSMHIRLGHQPLFVLRAETIQSCEWRMVEDGFIELKLPKWAGETRKSKVAPVKSGSASKRTVNDAQVSMLTVRIEEQKRERPLPKKSVVVQSPQPMKVVTKRRPAEPNPMPLHAYKRKPTLETFRTPRSEERTRSLLGDPAPGRSALDQREVGK
ncbi:hypothetical protein ABE527_14275 [Brucella sp. TWI432]